MGGDVILQKILILGGSGFIGRAVINEIVHYNQFEVYSTYYQNPILNQHRSFKLNIEDVDNMSSLLNVLKPQIVVSCLRGDFSKQLITHIKVAEYLKENYGNLYFFSTANVFDNDLSKPHNEYDLSNSNTEYGLYKIECEKKISEILHDNVSILRIPQVWGKHSPRMKDLLSSIDNNEDVHLYPNFFMNTNTDVMIAKQLCYIINNKLAGLFHLTSDDIANHKEFYSELIIRLGFENVKTKDSIAEKEYFALASKRMDGFPKQLRLTNKSVINYLTNL